MQVTVSSMTGYARTDGLAGPGQSWHWAWELKSVNSRGLDIRCRIPAGPAALEPEARRMVAARLARGSVTAILTLRHDREAATVRINQPLLRDLLALHEALARDGMRVEAARLDALLQVNGVLERPEPADIAVDEAALEQILAGLDRALDGLCEMRRHEGARLGEVLADGLATLAALVERAGRQAQEQAPLLRDRVRRQTDELLGTVPALDEERLAQEVALLATKADVREETDRLQAHVAACGTLLEQGGPIGRRLDFLCQELNREINTVCSKSADLALTRLGLELKAETERFREQVQNLE